MLDFFLQVIQFVVLMILVGLFMLVPMIGLYLMSEGVREIVHDFERWAELRRLKRKFKKAVLTEQPRILNFPEALSPNEVRMMRGIVGLPAPSKYASVFDETLAEHPEIDPRDILRISKEQDAADQETLDRATEYRNGIE